MVLIVEGDKRYAQNLADQIKDLGHPSQVVPNGLEGMKWLRSSQADLILVDQSASWVDGFRFCRLVKFHRKYQQIPVVILATVLDEEHRRLADTVKADGYVEKRKDPMLVIQWIKQFLSAPPMAQGKG